jgi:hypothetical protein
LPSVVAVVGLIHHLEHQAMVLRAVVAPAVEVPALLMEQAAVEHMPKEMLAQHQLLILVAVVVAQVLLLQA